MTKVLTAAQMREIDRRTIEEIGIPLVALMENAGRAVAEAAEEALPALAGRSILVVCGRGNNGGDGLVAARHLANRGHAVQVLLLGRIDDLRDPVVRAHAQSLKRLGVPLVEASDESALGEVQPYLFEPAEVLIDAIFGTGFRPPARGLEAAAIERIEEARASGAFVLAVDLPSGLDADTGEVSGPAASADLTVTFAAPKPAHFLAPAEERSGDLLVADISIPRHLVEAAGHRVELLDRELAAAHLPGRSPSAHKGSFGHLLVVAGSLGKTGAAVLTARAALRAGVGLVTVATPASCQPLVAAGAPELMTVALPESSPGRIGRAAIEPVLALLARSDALALGPGLGLGGEVAELARELMARAEIPAVVDADGLNAIDDLGRLGKTGRPLVLTPHPGEAGRLLGRPAAEINRRRLASAGEIARLSGAVTALKGHRTVVASPAGSAWINLSGSVALATGGTGDVLTGVIGALLAQGLAPEPAALLGVHLHGLAGERAAAERAIPGTVASDVIEALPAAWRILAGEDPDRGGGDGEPVAD